MRKIILFVAIFCLMIIPSVSAVCTAILDSSDYVEGEIVEVDMTCSVGNERSQSYTLNWTNSSGFQLEIDTGTTPSTSNTLFSETFTISSGYVATNGGTLNVNMTGSGLEGTDSATVSTAGASNLIITDVVISSSFLVGRFGALDFKVTDSSGNAVANAQCIIDIVDENDLPLAPAGGKTPVPSQGDGKVLYSLFFDENFVEEGKSYKWDMACTCLNTTASASNAIGVCTDGSNGNKINDFKHGETQFPFTMDSWLTVNTVVDRSEYLPRQTIFICSNVTNTRTTRTPLHIFHQVRCSSGTDNNNDLDRSLIITDERSYDNRGINAATTQMQCKEFVIPDIRHLEGKSSQCTASTNTWVVDEDDKKIKGYTTTSIVFNITSDTINIPIDWAEIVKNKFLGIINLSATEYSDWNGTGIGTIDVFLNSLRGESFDPRTTRSLPQISFDSFLTTRQIKEIIVWNATTNISSNLEFLEDGHLEIEIPNQDISPSGWYNITIEFEDFEGRITNATEDSARFLGGINSSAGTFDFSISVPNTPTLQVLVTGNGVTGSGEVLNRDVQITCQVDDHPETSKSFTVFTTDTFSFSQLINVPSVSKTYTMTCTGKDSKFGTFITSPATANFDKLDSGTQGGSVGTIKEKISDIADLIKEIVKESKTPILVIIGVMFAIFLLIMIKNHTDKTFTS